MIIINKNKKAASSWSIGKLLSIVLVVTLVILLIYGFSSGSIYKLYDNLDNFYNNVAYYFVGGDDYEGGQGSYTINAVILDEEREVLVDTQGYCSVNIEELGKRYGLNPAKQLVLLERGGWADVDFVNLEVVDFFYRDLIESFREYYQNLKIGVNGKEMKVEYRYFNKITGTYYKYGPNVFGLIIQYPFNDAVGGDIFYGFTGDCLYYAWERKHVAKLLGCPTAVLGNKQGWQYPEEFNPLSENIFETFKKLQGIDFQGKKYPVFVRTLPYRKSGSGAGSSSPFVNQVRGSYHCLGFYPKNSSISGFDGNRFVYYCVSGNEEIFLFRTDGLDSGSATSYVIKNSISLEPRMYSAPEVNQNILYSSDDEWNILKKYNELKQDLLKACPN